MTARRRPLGDIGNTLSLGAHLKIKEKPKSICETPRIDEKGGDYVKEIYEHFRKAECKNRPSTNYMTQIQTDVNEKMRAILVDWMVDVHLKFKLLPETLFLAVEILDRFLDKKMVNRQKLQLVGVVALLLGAKYEEIFPPEVKDYIYISANTYPRDDILRMERLVFQTMEHNLTIPTMYVFLNRGLQVMDADLKTTHLATFFAELVLLDYKMLNYLPSVVGASCVYTAYKFLGVKDAWHPILEHYSGYKFSDLERCACDIMLLARSPHNPKIQAVRKKYSYTKFSEASKLVIVDQA